MQPGSSVDRQASALLARLTLDEKIGQMVQVDMNAIKDKNDIAKYGFGSLLSGGNSDPADISPAGWARMYDDFQSYALKSRLAIPILYGVDAVHGHNNVDGAVIFPHNIALGATRNPALVERAARVTAAEVAGTGIDWTFAPCVTVPRNERWGRTYEGFGETPELASLMGAAYVRGLQGGKLSGRESVLACTKHFLGDGGTTDGIDQGDTRCDEATLRRIHLPGYVEAIRAGSATIMVSYNSWNGQKLHGHRQLLTDLLKGELGFRGFLVSDWAAIDQLPGDYRSDVEASINAGLDMIMIPNGPGQENNYVDFINHLKELVAAGKVPLARVDDAVLRILRVKLEMGLFKHPFGDKNLIAQVGSAAHRAVARECVRESLVLLKNQGRVLPLSRQATRIHVAGKCADDLGYQCGGWTIEWQGRTGQVVSNGTTVLQALRREVKPGTTVTFSTNGLGAAGASVAVVVIGEPPYAEMKGDRTDLTLAPEDVQAIRNCKQAGVPVVAVLFSGRPLIITDVLDQCDALVAAWLPGTEGAGVTDVLFGRHHPTGKLPCTWPRTMGQIPINVGDESYAPLFPFGFGLKY
jgi:beta-glucosidase